MELSHSDISGIMTKAPCEAALMGERHVRIEISDFVMRTFVLANSPFFPYNSLRALSSKGGLSHAKLSYRRHRRLRRRSPARRNIRAVAQSTGGCKHHDEYQNHRIFC